MAARHPPIRPEKRENPSDPHPLPLWKSFLGLQISRNLHAINSLHFGNVNESVTANPRFCPLLAPKKAVSDPKKPLFRRFSQVLGNARPGQNQRRKSQLGTILLAPLYRAPFTTAAFCFARRLTASLCFTISITERPFSASAPVGQACTHLPQPVQFVAWPQSSLRSLTMRE